MSNKLSNCLATRLNGAALWLNVSCRTIQNIVAKKLNSTGEVSSISTGRTIVFAKIALFNAKDRLI